MKKYILLATYFLLPTTMQAHCPLCTVGAGALAIAAASLGVSTPTVGVFIGAFALAMSLWIAKLIKQKYFPHQDTVVTLLIFLSTIIPIMPLIREYREFYVSLAGEYGTVLHNTYLVNLYLLGVVAGAILLYISPTISRRVTETRGRAIAYQGLVITFSLLLVAGLIFQIVI